MEKLNTEKIRVESEMLQKTMNVDKEVELVEIQKTWLGMTQTNKEIQNFINLIWQNLIKI